MINIKQTQIILFAAITILSINSNLLSMDKRQQAKNQAAADRREQHRLQTALPTATIHHIDVNASYNALLAVLNNQ
jgi:hypothetical protein